MAMSWHMIMEFEPPLIAYIASNRDHSFMDLRTTRECVIAIPKLELVETIVAVGNCSGRETHKSQTFQLTRRRLSA